MQSVKPQHLNPRLFLAIAVPTELETQIETATRRVRKDFGEREIEARWIPKENWHVTLVFIGESPLKDGITEAARRVAARSAPFHLDIRGFGAFPEESSARVIWAGVQKARALLNLQGELEEELRGLGLTLEDREYQPHLSLARLRNPKRVREFIDSFRKKDFGKINVGELVLYQSILAAPFPRYEPLERFALSGAAPSLTE